MNTAVGIAIGTDTIESSTPNRPGAGADSVLSVWPDGRAQLGAIAEAGVYREFVDRVGDPVPVIATDGSARLGADLVALAIGELAVGASHLTLAYPAWWGAYQLGILRSSLTCTRARDLPTSWVSRPVAARIGAGVTGHEVVLVVDIGATNTELSLVTGNRVLATSTNEVLGSTWLDRVLAAHLSSRLSAPVARHEMPALLAACARARSQLETEPYATVEASPLHARLDRAEFEQLIEERVASVVASATRALARERDLPVAAVLLVGEPARTPRLIDLLTSRVALPLIVPDDPARLVVRGAVTLAGHRHQQRATAPHPGPVPSGRPTAVIAAGPNRAGSSYPRQSAPAHQPPAHQTPAHQRPAYEPTAHQLPAQRQPPVQHQPPVQRHQPPARLRRLRTALTVTAAGLALALGGMAATGGDHAAAATDRHWQDRNHV
jgi:hypothetical protein